MDLPLKLKWLGDETENICEFLSPYQPLILISPVPHLSRKLDGLHLLPGAISQVWDLRVKSIARPVINQEELEKFTFEHFALCSGEDGYSAIFEFYFKVYLKSIALDYLLGVPFYIYIENLHQRLLNRELVVFTRVIFDGEVVGGCLLNRVSLGEEQEYRDSLNSSSTGVDPNVEVKIVVLDIFAIDQRFAERGLTQLLLYQTAQWAQHNGYAALATAPMPAVHIDSGRDNMELMFGGEASLVRHQRPGALLYCDLARCCYLQHDFFYFTDEQPMPCLYYVANVLPDASKAIRLLNSIKGINKRVYTRHLNVQRVVAAAGLDCVLLA
jgi:hypothetical protein